MSAFSDYLEDRILKAVFKGTAFPAPPAATYLALFRGNPGDGNSGNLELNNADSVGYTRVAIPTTGWSDPVGGAGPSSISNLNSLEFPEARGNWASDAGGNPGQITHFGLFDAGGGGNLLVYGALDAPRTIATGDVLRFSAGALTVQIA